MRRILLLAAVAGTLAALAAPAVAQAPAGKPDLERAQKIASEVCLACHGPNGNSVRARESEHCGTAGRVYHPATRSLQIGPARESHHAGDGVDAARRRR